MSVKKLALPAGPLLAALLYFLLLPDGASQAATSNAMAITAAVTACCVVWWLFEPVPIPVTSLLPLALFQLSGVLSAAEVGQAYGNPLILLLLGGFLLSQAMARSGAHRRLALFMVRLFGGHSSRQLVFGFMVTAAVLSMWISNTATTLMLLPVALAVIDRAPDTELAKPLMLGIAYAASIGGIGTPIGTPPNLIFMQVYSEQFHQEIGFTQWMGWALPVVLVMLPLSGLWLTRRLRYRGGFVMPETGRWRSMEKRVLWVFALTALAWITRKEPFGGWREWLHLPAANDASVALLAVVAMFIIADDRGRKLLDWETAAKIPWGVLLLFGGGIALAKAFSVSGLGASLAGELSALGQMPAWLMVFTVCLGVSFLTETTSNTASTVLLMPIMASTALATQINPKLLMAPAAISASFAFMMPVATAPNSIVYGSGCFSTRDMAREGLVLNLAGAIVCSAVLYTILS